MEVEALEKLLKRFTRMLPGLECNNYDRLDKPGLFSLACLRLRDDLMDVYNIMRGTDKVFNQSIYPHGGNVNY